MAYQQLEKDQKSHKDDINEIMQAQNKLGRDVLDQTASYSREIQEGLLELRKITMKELTVLQGALQVFYPLRTV